MTPYHLVILALIAAIVTVGFAIADHQIAPARTHETVCWVR